MAKPLGSDKNNTTVPAGPPQVFTVNKYLNLTGDNYPQSAQRSLWRAEFSKLACRHSKISHILIPIFIGEMVVVAVQHSWAPPADFPPRQRAQQRHHGRCRFLIVRKSTYSLRSFRVDASRNRNRRVSTLFSCHNALRMPFRCC